jgi:hypothetical protein
MSYDLALYRTEFLQQAIDNEQTAWLNPLQFETETIAQIGEWLRRRGYLLDDPELRDYSHPREEWGIQLTIFDGEIAFTIPYWDDIAAAITAALEDAQELARFAGLALYDPQTRRELT